MSEKLNFNGRPKTVDANYTATSYDPKPVANSSFFTIQPDNREAHYRFNFGSTTFDKTLPINVPVPYPVFAQWNNNQVTVKNLSTPAEATIQVGYFGTPADVSSPSSGSAVIGQFESCNIATNTSNMTLSLTCRSTNSVMIAIIQGGQLPVFVALNTDNLPPIFDQVPNLVKVAGNNWSTNNNWFGATLSMVNVSLTDKSTDVEINLT